MTDYKKYSLGQVENFLYDAMSSGATPKEIYDTIRGVVEDNYYTYKKCASEAYELLALLNGNGEGHITGWEESSQYTEQELNAMCDAAEAKDKVKKWIIPVDDDYNITFPEDLLEQTGWKEGDTLQWIDQGDGSFKLIKQEKKEHPSWVKGNELSKVKTYQEMIDDGWTMTDDGFWIKEN
jgi:bifunctional DNA-binding transcriptional regulator/antitoxin component of YhaV-PrlF toxin-antitoxin module